MTEADFSLVTTEDGYRAVWSGLGTLWVRDAQDTVFEAHPQADGAVVAKLRRGPVQGLERYLTRTGFAFHASAVELGGHAVLVTGPSGAGKSTTAALLVARAGASLLADDVAVVRCAADGLWVEPTEQVHLLDEPARGLLGFARLEGRRPVAAPRVAARAARCRALVTLEPAWAPPTLVRVRGAAAMVDIARAQMRPVLDGRVVEDFELLSQVARHVAVHRLTREQGDVEGLVALFQGLCLC